MKRKSEKSSAGVAQSVERGTRNAQVGGSSPPASTTLLAPSILSADFSNLGKSVQEVENAGADLIHIDVMDGRFVPNITVGIPVVSSLRKVCSLPFDVHLMIVEPERYFEDFVKAGADWISFHYEAVVHHNRALNSLKELGVKAGIALNPSTPVSVLEEVLEIVDFVLVMSVNPGFGGQKFIESSLRKIEKLRDIKEKHKLGFLIEIDGGINAENLRSVLLAGADVIVAGSSIFSNNPAKNVLKFKEIIRGVRGETGEVNSG